MSFTVEEALSRRQFLKGLGTAGLAAGMVSGLSACKMMPAKSYMGQLGHSTRHPMNYWVDVMMKTTSEMPLNPPVATRAFAMAHLAGFLAINGIEGKYNTPYNVSDGPQGANAEVAFGVAFCRAFGEAAQTSLVFDKMEFLDRYPNDEAKSRGIAYGEYVSDIVIKLRTQDGAQASQADSYFGRFPTRNDPMGWSPTGGFYNSKPGPEIVSFRRALLPGWGYVKPWIMQDKAQFLPPPYPDIRSPEFAAMFEKVRELGRANSTVRTPKQTDIAHFWEAGARTVSPPGIWQLLALEITKDLGLPLIEQSRMYTLMSIAQADTAIATWYNKFLTDVARPETAIRQRGDDLRRLGINVTPDPTWNSLLATPPFAAYTSGHSGFSTASAVVIADVIGRDDIHFSSKPLDCINWPEQLKDVQMSWHSLFEAAEEASNSREYGGIHWEADHVEGLNLGRKIGHYVVANSFVRRG